MAPYHHPDRLNESIVASTSTSTYNNQEHLPQENLEVKGRKAGREPSAASRGIPGSIPSGSISKLKAQKRQTERLLKRDDLTPDVRITSERRLKTLILELEKATNGSLEKQMVTRYRGIKFFERQKVLRKIKAAKKALLTSIDDPTFLTNLLDSRIDLYYILKYPKTEKYVALFPEGTYVSHSPIPASKDPKDSAVIRSNLRESIKSKLISGELELEVEGGDLGIEGEEDVGVAPGASNGNASAGVEGEGEEEERSSSKRVREEVVEVEKVVVEQEKEIERKVKKVKKSIPSEEPIVVEQEAEIEEVEPEVEEEEEVEEIEETAEKRSVRESKKEKKDKKDAKRKEKKELEAKKLLNPSTTTATTPIIAEVEKPVKLNRKATKNAKKAIVEVTVPAPAVVESWAEADDFFS